MKLYIYEKEAVVGQEVICHSGEKATLLRWTEPHKPNSSGFVHIKLLEGGTMEFYAGVIGGKFK